MQQHLSGLVAGSHYKAGAFNWLCLFFSLPLCTQRCLWLLMGQVIWCLLLFCSVILPLRVTAQGMLDGRRDEAWTQWTARTNGSHWPQLSSPCYRSTHSVSRRGTFYVRCVFLLLFFYHYYYFFLQAPYFPIDISHHHAANRGAYSPVTRKPILNLQLLICLRDMSFGKN